MKRWHPSTRGLPRSTARTAAPSTPPEQLLRALLPQAFYSIRRNYS